MSLADPHLKTDDVRITRTRPLLTPAALEEEIPAPGSALELVSRARGAIFPGSRVSGRTGSMPDACGRLSRKDKFLSSFAMGGWVGVSRSG